MNSSVAFESQTEKEERRKQRRHERNAILSKMEAKYHDKEEGKKRAALQGEGSWMLPSVEDQLRSRMELNEVPVLCSKKKKNKKKKAKKCHKHKKHKGKEKHSSSSSASEADESHEWTERTAPVADDFKPRIYGPRLERESWMTVETPFAQSIAHSIKDADHPKNELIDKPGQHRLELNPYWKDGGTGLPKELSPKNDVLDSMTGDAGLGWLHKAMQRCIEMAKEENRTVEEVVAERHGSLEALQNRIDAAEAKSKSSSAKYGSLKFRRPREESEKNDRSYSAKSCQRTVVGNWRKKQAENHSSVRQCAHPDADISHKKTEESSGKESGGSSSDESSTHENEELRERKDNAPPRLLSEEEINKLGAQIIKAELIGDETLAQKLKQQLQTAQKDRSATAAPATVTRSDESNARKGSDDNIAILTRTDRFGMTRPVAKHQNPTTQLCGGHRKRKFERMHEASGQRTKYFADDDKYSLKDLVEREKLNTAEDVNTMFARLSGKKFQGVDEDMDDKVIDRAALRQSASLMESKERQLAIIEHKKMSASLAKCKFCFENVPKHLIIAVGLKVYLCLPGQRSMVEGHCFIVPIQHETQGTKCDEDVWDEIKIFQKGLTDMFKNAGKGCLFFETSLNLKRHPHMHVECIPVPKETGEMAPLYFKKALQECESEWAQNRQILDLSKKDVRHAIPKGFPYFSIEFGTTGGYAHVIDGEKTFSSFFGREVIGGMLDMDETQWRCSHNEAFEEQRKKVVKFAEEWKHYDCTKRLKLV